MNVCTSYSVLAALVLLIVRTGATTNILCENKDADVLIIGAGLAGLGAAQTLSKNGMDNFLIIEQANEIGGRVKSRKFAGTTIELGAQWILSADKSLPVEEQNPILALANRCNITYRPVPFGTGMKIYTRTGDDISTSPELFSAFERYVAAVSPAVVEPILESLGDDDIPLSNGLSAAGWFPQTPVEDWVEYLMVDFGGVAEDPRHLSYKRAIETDSPMLRNKFGSSNYVVTDEAGYTGIAQCIANDFMTENESRLKLGRAVTTIEWNDGCVCVSTVVNRGEEQRYCGTYAISTIPLAVIQNNRVNFEPRLPENICITLHRLTMGRFLKIYAAYNETFWDTVVDIIGHIDDLNGRDFYPMFAPWSSFFPEDNTANVIQAFLFGDTAKRVGAQDPEITRRQIGDVLRNMYGESVTDPIAIMQSPFTTDPYFLGNLGGIPTPGVTPETYRLLSRPVGNLYFAGDAFQYPFFATTHGAYISGTDAADKIVQIMKQPPIISFINDSPRVIGRNMSAEFTVSKPVEILDCIMDREMRQDCSSGRLVFENLSEGRHILKVIARNEPINDRSAETRAVFVSDSPHCAVHLINNGITSYESTAVIEFTSTGLPVTEFTCNMDSVRIFSCSSPLELQDLSKGRHRVRIRPMCEGQQRQQSFSFFI